MLKTTDYSTLYITYVMETDISVIIQLLYTAAYVWEW